MRKIFVIMLLALVPVMFFADPFGLKMGMNKNDVKKACNGTSPEYVENDCYYIYPAKTHPLFKHYVAYIDDEMGLYGIKAVSDDISTNDYGTEIKNAFSEIKERVSKTYGVPRIIDEIDSKSIWKGDNYWVTALSEGARTYAAIWETTINNKLKDNLDYVCIYANANYLRIGWIILEYGFSNMNAVKDAQDDVF